MIPAISLSKNLSLVVASSFDYASKEDNPVTLDGKSSWKIWSRDKTNSKLFGGRAAEIMLKL